MATRARPPAPARRVASAARPAGQSVFPGDDEYGPLAMQGGSTVGRASVGGAPSEAPDALHDRARRRPGRPRDARADAAILEAVVDLLVEEGFGGLTIDAVAHRAGVGKATIYRRWEGKERLVLDALAATKADAEEIPDTGSVRGDLIAIYAQMAEPVNQQTVVRLMPALASEAAINPDLSDRLKAFVSERRIPSRTVLDRAKERGEIAADADVDLCIDLLTGPFMYRLFFTGSKVDHKVIEDSIDVVLRGVAPSKPAG
jgi:AcrR family transcriptional regulator